MAAYGLSGKNNFDATKVVQPKRDLQYLHADERGTVNWLLKDLDAMDYFAGDVERLPKHVWSYLEKIRAKRGKELYSDLLLALTYKRFSPEQAESLWQEILTHKYFMSERLGRNVGIRVAALDFLHNQRGLMRDLRLLPEGDLDSLLLYVNEDGLTGVYNHRYFQEQLRHELARAKRYDRDLSLLLLDLDHFKQYNDQLGHRRGDQLLKEIAEFLNLSRRDADTVARYGGDEFAIILPETSREEAFNFAQRLRVNFERRRFGSQLLDGQIITVSIGVVSFPIDARSAEDLIEASDQALYRGKHLGRNRIQLGQDLKPDTKEKKNQDEEIRSKIASR